MMNSSIPVRVFKGFDLRSAFMPLDITAFFAKKKNKNIYILKISSNIAATIKIFIHVLTHPPHIPF